jgi:hypothetical protein
MLIVVHMVMKLMEENLLARTWSVIQSFLWKPTVSGVQERLISRREWGDHSLFLNRAGIPQGSRMPWTYRGARGRPRTTRLIR